MKLSIYIIATLWIVTTISCSKKEYKIHTPKDVLQNDCIKRTQGPNIVGQTIEFAYAMAILAEKGKLKVKMVLTGEGTSLKHVVEGEIDLSDANDI